MGSLSVHILRFDGCSISLFWFRTIHPEAKHRERERERQRESERVNKTTEASTQGRIFRKLPLVREGIKCFFFGGILFQCLSLAPPSNLLFSSLVLWVMDGESFFSGRCVLSSIRPCWITFYNAEGITPQKVNKAKGKM